MKLGENIIRLRSKAGLSQEQLAQLLGVSRQSVSKWETGSATPDLVHLLRLCEIFSTSLDALVGLQPQPNSEPAAAELRACRSRAVRNGCRAETGPFGPSGCGLVLLSMAFLIMLACLMMGARLLEGLFFALPFALCGVICISVSFHPGLWCGWALYALFTLLLPLTTGITPLAVFNPMLYTGLSHPLSIAVSWLLFLSFAALCLFTGRAFSHKPLRLNRRHAVYIALWLAAYLLPILLVQMENMTVERQLAVSRISLLSRSLLTTCAGIFLGRLAFSKKAER